MAGNQAYNKSRPGEAPTQLRSYGLFLRALQQYYSGRRTVIGAAAVEEDRRTRLMGGRADNDVTWRPARRFCDYRDGNDINNNSENTCRIDPVVTQTYYIYIYMATLFFGVTYAIDNNFG